MIVKCTRATLYIGGVEFGQVDMIDLPPILDEREVPPMFPTNLSATLTLEYKGTKRKRGKRTKVKKSNRPLQK